MRRAKGGVEREEYGGRGMGWKTEEGKGRRVKREGVRAEGKEGSGKREGAGSRSRGGEALDGEGMGGVVLARQGGLDRRWHAYKDDKQRAAVQDAQTHSKLGERAVCFQTTNCDSSKGGILCLKESVRIVYK